MLLVTVSTAEAAVAFAVLLALTASAVLLMLRAVRRSQRSAEVRTAELVSELDRRTDALSKEVGNALARERESNRLARTFGRLSASIDLDEVLGRTLDAAVALPGVDAAHVAVVASGGETVVRATGLTDTEAEDLELVPAVSGRRIRALVVEYDPRADGDDGAVAKGLALPLRSLDVSVGLLTLFARKPEHEFAEDVIVAAEELAAQAGPAVDNAARYNEARRLADMDTHTGLHNRRYFHEALARETSRSQRYERPLALIVFDLDEFKEINDRLGHLAGDAILEQVGDEVRSVVRASDIACRVGGDEFGIILAESSIEDAERLSERLRSHLPQHPIPQAGRAQISISAGIAALRPHDDATALFERADDALYRAKEAGKGRVAIATTAIGRAAAEPPHSAISRVKREER